MSAGKKYQIDKNFFFQITNVLNQITKFTSFLLKNIFLKKISIWYFFPALTHILFQWKDATIYPIPKPMDWNCSLKNTRPITLLETARKLMTKIMTNRLANTLHRHNVLKGNNYAGLPGGSCHTPIHILESVISDAK